MMIPDLASPVTCPGCGGHAAQLLPGDLVVIWQCLNLECNSAFAGQGTWVEEPVENES